MERRSSHALPSRVGAGSLAAAGGGGGGVGGSAAEHFDFNLNQSKNRVLREFEEKVPPNFRKFFQSEGYDRLLQTFLLYFAAIFQTEWVVQTMEKARRMHLDGYNPYVIAQRLKELEEETKDLRMQISPIYTSIIMQYSSYKRPQQDRYFFETLYSTLITLADEAFSKLQRRPDIEREVGSLFRSRHFNMYERQNKPARSVDSLTVKELYSVKHETENRALNAKLLSSLFEKPATLGMQVASVTNSPLVTQYITSPIVSRSMMKDPEQRKTVLRAEAAHESSKQLKNVFRTAAMVHGVNVVAMQANGVADMTLPEDAEAELGIVDASKARRHDKKMPRGPHVPEAAGLPVDDQFMHVVMLRRYVLHGPSLGLDSSPSMGNTSASALSGAADAAATGLSRAGRGEGAGSKMLAALSGVQKQAELDAIHV
uniref:Uncharacterized protein n=1 Tax=Chlamydomonas euryale TaxID=1486919 RepID=A0A7R9YXI8_9CHLO